MGDVSKQFLEEIMRTIGVYWSDSEADSELTVNSEEDEKYRWYGPDVDLDLDQDDQEMWTEGPQPGPQGSEGDQGTSAEIFEFHPSVSESECADLRELLDRKPPHYIFTGTISRALFKVCKLGLHNVAEVLLQFHADPNYQASSSTVQTALHVAVDKGDTEMVKLLVENGASLDSEDFGESPLFLACQKKDLGCIRTLLDLGADVNCEDYEGRSLLGALFLESNCDVSPEVLELLLERGGDPNSVESVLSNLLQNNLNRDRETLEKLCVNCVKVVCLLLQYSFEPQCCCEGDGDPEGLLFVSLENFSRLFPLTGLLLERKEAFVPDHPCWSRTNILTESLRSSLQDCSEDEARLLVDKANALLDLPIVRPPLLRFNLSPGPGQSQDSDPGTGAQSVHQGPMWVVNNAVAPLQSLCRAFIRRSLLPWPLEEKVQALPIPHLLKELLLPLKP